MLSHDNIVFTGKAITKSCGGSHVSIINNKILKIIFIISSRILVHVFTILYM